MIRRIIYMLLHKEGLWQDMVDNPHSSLKKKGSGQKKHLFLGLVVALFSFYQGGKLVTSYMHAASATNQKSLNYDS